ncbi:Abnormal spindle-like microcephaly-associated protein-like [Hondaea fermentalgiana]|uniref:Abnormal spindle-like microcephaly-associated protein-like n=1 Tax=Hondaea fermentalgiana TaxID=2315210 RepID=A0A2R5G991_9STRA|nr:Abnormal spindle-like microcephaly-associated protein-like [Hondaea fermentalgiana]|eukprot:GBG27616.1 Abnormal spindle-like microcephaly-associated protein-like [Hondaea fermentalgiana]
MSPPPKCPAVVGGRSSALTLRWPGAVPLGAVVEIARDQSGPKAAVPSEPGAFLRARERHVKSDADKELVFNLLDAATWYWIRTRQDAEQNNQYSRMIAVRTPAARPAPVLALDASYTLYDDSHAASARGRHMFVKLKWRASDDRGADIEEYIVQRCSIKEPDWKIVYRTTSCACVLSAMHDPDDYYETIAAQRLSAIARAEEAARAQALAEEAEAKQRAIEEAEAERARLQAEAEAEEARLQAEAEAERQRLLAEQARIEEEARAKAETAAQEKAATLLQSHARASISRQQFQRQMREIVRIQAFLRMLPPRRAALRRQSVRKAAAHFMSCVIVTAQRHCEEENRVMVDVAAIRLQSRFRQFGAKRKMTRMLEQKHAAIMLQKHVRTHMTRKSISKQQTAATVIQARFRSHQEQVRFEARVQQIVVRAAIRLQACYRAHHAQKQLGQRKRHILKSIVRVNVTDAGTRSACGSYEQMEVTDAAKYIMTAPGTDDTYLIERSEVQAGQVPIWTLKLVKGSGETHLLYVNKLEGGSLKPPVRSWEAISGRPPAPSLVCKTSDSYLKDMELMNREAVVVTDSGCAEVHGRYFQSGVADGVPQFVMQKAGATYSLLRSPYADRRIWLLVGSLMFHIDETDEEAAASGGRATSLPPSTPQSRRQSRRASRKDSMTTKRIYFVNMENGSAKKPPLDGWQVAQHGKLPEPLFVRQRKLQAEDE